MRYNGKQWRLKCEAVGCSSQPRQGFPADGFPRFCTKHRLWGCVDMKTKKRCAREGCRLTPSFAPPGSAGKDAKWCKRHAEDGCVNVVALRCRIEGCSTQASFGVDGKAEYCAAHRPEGSVSTAVAKRACRAPGCTTHATFGREWQNPRHCRRHRQADEDNCTRKRCLAPLPGGGECLTLPSFGPPGSRPISCAKHRKAGYKAVVTKRKSCAAPGCAKNPSFGPPPVEGRARVRARCATHALGTDVNNGSKKSAGYGLPAARFRVGDRRSRKRRAGKVFGFAWFDLSVGWCTG